MFKGQGHIIIYQFPVDIYLLNSYLGGKFKFSSEVVFVSLEPVPMTSFFAISSLENNNL